jgi:hypothetical protein
MGKAGACSAPGLGVQEGGLDVEERGSLVDVKEAFRISG